MSIESEIRSRLTAEFQPVQLEVVNDSAKHAGHSGDDGTGESHFAVRGAGWIEPRRAAPRGAQGAGRPDDAGACYGD